MLVIRLARTGKKKQAYFRIVVADKQKAVGAKFVEIVGNYDPHAKKFVINTEKLEKYLKNGAVPSNTVAKLLAREKIEMPKWVKIKEKVSKKKEKKKDGGAPAAKKPEAGAESNPSADAQDDAKASEEGNPSADSASSPQAEAPLENTRDKQDDDKSSKESSSEGEKPAGDSNNEPPKEDQDGKTAESSGEAEEK